MIGEYNKTAAKTLLYPSLPPFIQALLKALQTPDGATTDSGLKKEILKGKVLMILILKGKCCEEYIYIFLYEEYVQWTPLWVERIATWETNWSELRKKKGS